MVILIRQSLNLFSCETPTLQIPNQPLENERPSRAFQAKKATFVMLRPDGSSHLPAAQSRK